MAKTVETIAAALNISITTVRLVLNNKAQQYRISEKTQKRINDYVAEHGYTVNHAARSLKLNKTDTLGLIIPRLSNVFFSTLAEKLEIRCREAGYQLMISCTYSDLKRENKLVEALVERNVDGLFVVPSSQQAQNHHLKRTSRPLVLLDRDFDSTEKSLVVSDNRHGSIALTQAMFNAGKLPIFFMAGDAEQPTIKERMKGYTSVLVEQGIKDCQQWILETAHNRREDGEKLMLQFLAQHNAAPPAFIASSLPVLEGALSVLRAHFGYIPPDINIGTFDEHPMLGFLSNNIWSVRQNEDAWAEKAMDAMLQLINGDEQKVRAIVPMTLIYRARASGQE